MVTRISTGNFLRRHSHFSIANTSTVLHKMGDTDMYASMARNTTGAATVKVVHEALASPNLFVFGELCDVPSVQQVCLGYGVFFTNFPHPLQLAESDETQPTFNLLQVFAYGTYADYQGMVFYVLPCLRGPSTHPFYLHRYHPTAQRARLPELNPQQLKKLKQLSLVELASKTRHLPYSVLQEALDIPDVRVLEDAIIDSISANLLTAKLDQSSRCIEVKDVIGRDVRHGDLDGMIATLGAWADRSLAAINELDTMIAKVKSCEEIRQVYYPFSPPKRNTKNKYPKHRAATKIFWIK